MQSVDTDASFVYNENGLRVQKTVNGVVTKYTLHGKNVVHMTRGNDELHFFYDAQNKPAVVVLNGTSYSYVKNLQGDIVAVLDGNGTAVVQYKYDAWGRQIDCTFEAGNDEAEALSTLNPFRYRGYVYDEETEIYYLGSRYYCSLHAHWLSADCFIGVNCDHVTNNVYVYCGNNPIIRRDTSGCSWKDTISGLLHSANDWILSQKIDTAAIGAFFLMMEEDEQVSGVYHARVDCWQQYFGYNELYDWVFDVATDMKPQRFFFDYNDVTYVLWCWKGDYINLGAGAELGIYTGSGWHKQVDTSLAMPMSMTLSHNGSESITYAPQTPQWWITSFNSNWLNVQADELTATFTITFTDPNMYRAFYATYGQAGGAWSFNCDTYSATLIF